VAQCSDLGIGYLWIADVEAQLSLRMALPFERFALRWRMKDSGGSATRRRETTGPPGIDRTGSRCRSDIRVGPFSDFAARLRAFARVLDDGQEEATYPPVECPLTSEGVAMTMRGPASCRSPNCPMIGHFHEAIPITHEGGFARTESRRSSCSGCWRANRPTSASGQSPTT
jgi:hypothetical protein